MNKEEYQIRQIGSNHDLKLIVKVRFINPKNESAICTYY